MPDQSGLKTISSRRNCEIRADCGLCDETSDYMDISVQPLGAYKEWWSDETEKKVLTQYQETSPGS